MLDLVGSIPAEKLKKFSFPENKNYRSTWVAFYSASGELDKMNILIRADPGIWPSIIEAIKQKKMYSRRYAIGALGYIGDRGAIKTLQEILNDQSELDYYRGDALLSLFQIDEMLGREEADRILRDNPNSESGSFELNIAKTITKDPESIKKRWTNEGIQGISISPKK